MRYPAVGQVWRSNDPREIRAVRVLSLGTSYAIVENVVSKLKTQIRLNQFRTGSRGWSRDA